MKNEYNDKKRFDLLEQFEMKQGTLELIFFALIFLSLQFWWIRMTIKNGRTGEVDKWGQKTNPKKLNELEKVKQDLEKLFRSQFSILLKLFK